MLNRFNISESASLVDELVSLLGHPAIAQAEADENPRLITSMVTFLRLITEKRISAKFLPFLLFQDAVNLQNAVTSDSKFLPKPPQKECAAFHGE